MKKLIYFFVLLILISSVSLSFANAQDINGNKQDNPPKINNGFIPEEKSSYMISVIDPTPDTNPLGAFYPGLRGGNQLIIYTPKYGERTGTNEFGREAVVVKGVVVDITGGNSLIPKDGFVISGHGRAKDWINRNLIIGSFIKTNPVNNIIESKITPESYIFKTNQSIGEVKRIIHENKREIKGYEYKISNNYLKSASKTLSEARKAFLKQNYDKSRELSNSAGELAKSALYYAVPSIQGEFHGIWLRPVEKTPDDIAKTLDKLHSTGINNLFIESYYHGYTIFPSKTLASYGVIPQRKEFQGWDPLKVWIEEAHKRNIKVHVWFQTFYTGNENISLNPAHVLSVHPEWANLQRKNYASEKPMPSKSEHNGYFLDPANPDVQKYLTALLTEVVQNYSPDGINIDYIRYPASLPTSFPDYINSTWGYTQFARNEFKNIYGKDPVELSLEDPLWQKWIEYRQNKVSGFVSGLRNIVKDRKIMLSTVIFPDLGEGPVVKLQNWKQWGDNCYVDAFTPLVLGSDKFLVGTYLKGIKDAVDARVNIYPGLFQPFTGATPEDLLQQIIEARKSGAQGMVIFDYAHLSEDYIKAINSRAFR